MPDGVVESGLNHGTQSYKKNTAKSGHEDLSLPPLPALRGAQRPGADMLLRAAREAKRAESVFDLGGGVFKKRVARRGGGTSGGFRTLLVCVHQDVVIFQYGFAKSERDNIDAGELRALKSAARVYAAMTVEQLSTSQQLIEMESTP